MPPRNVVAVRTWGVEKQSWSLTQTFYLLVWTDPVGFLIKDSHPCNSSSTSRRLLTHKQPYLFSSLLPHMPFLSYPAWSSWQTHHCHHLSTSPSIAPSDKTPAMCEHDHLFLSISEQLSHPLNLSFPQLQYLGHQLLPTPTPKWSCILRLLSVPTTSPLVHTTIISWLKCCHNSHIGLSFYFFFPADHYS